jgi:hypothetical protein
VSPTRVLAVTRVDYHEIATFVEGDDGSNDVRLRWLPEGEGTVVRDRTARVVAPLCAERDEHSVVCPTLGNESELGVFLEAGDDYLDLSGSPHSLDIELLGGHGDDTVTGSGFEDFIDGGAGDDEVLGRGGDDFIAGSFGADVLRGGRGNDRVGVRNTGIVPEQDRGDLGRDLYLGGPGDDRLNGSDHVPDLGFLGGAGKDRCTQDFFGDPKPHACEKIIRRD